MTFNALSPRAAARPIRIGIALASLGLAAGCGSGTHSDSAPATSTTSTSLAPAPTESMPDMSANAPGYKTGYGITFKSPSGKFMCGIVDDHVGCNGRFPQNVPLAHSCGGRMSRPNTISVSRGAKAEFVNACSPAAGDDSKVLPYNIVLRVAHTQCVIHEQTGVSCDTGDGHGFTVSDTAYTLK